ncbi:MAG TPA: hypothetical protein VLX56_02830 [Nitrososphaerales archaeon]|nr:hypothetical protein [Nitrososphaerales archaeon]
MSLISRLLGFGLALLGAFSLGYGQGIASLGSSLGSTLAEGLGSIPGLVQQLQPTIMSYVQNNIVPPDGTYSLAGAAVAIVGAFLVLWGDRKFAK